MICPKCGSEQIATVASINGLWVERYKKCKACKYNFQTCEIIKVDRELIEYQKVVLKQILKDSKKQKGA